MKFVISYLICFFIISISKLVSAEPIYLKWADNLVGINTVEQKFREFSGNVQLQQGDVHVRCDFAKQFLTENRAELTGNVVVTQNKMTMKAPKINYFGNEYTAYATGGVQINDQRTTLTALEGIYQVKTAIANFRGNVVIVDDSVTIYSDFITFHRKTKNSYAFNNVNVIGKYTNVVITGDTITNIPSENYTIATGNPVLFQIDSTLIKVDSLTAAIEDIPRLRFEYDTLSISADTMEAFREPNNERYIFKTNVEIFKGNTTAKSNQANYLKDAEGIELRGDPVVWYENTQLFGDSVNIFIPENKLSKIQAMANAMAVSQSDSNEVIRKNQLTGQEIEILLDESKISKINSYKDARSLYFFVDEEGNNGANRTSTDTIRFVFKDGELEDVYWLGVSFGENISENILFRNEKKYYLPQYRWLDNKPNKKNLVLKKRNN